jgi:AP-2 complex subunit alpha
VVVLLQDLSIRKRALDLLYAVCDGNDVKVIVPSLLSYLKTAVISIREELVLKIADLAERFASDYKWYINVVLQLISLAGDFVSDEIWWRVVQVVKLNPELADYAARTCARFLQSARVHQTGIKVAAYVLGEFGHAVSSDDASAPADELQNSLLLADGAHHGAEHAGEHSVQVPAG